MRRRPPSAYARAQRMLTITAHIGRLKQAAREANARGDWARLEKLIALLDRLWVGKSADRAAMAFYSELERTAPGTHPE